MKASRNVPTHETVALRRELGVFDATLMGLGAMVGTGVFVSIGIAAGVTGPSVLLAIVLAGLVATCNALSSAQFAATLPVSGGTYEYGYAYLTPWLGFTAGWMFLCAKTASAATAALGFAGYLMHALGIGGPKAIAAIAAVAILTAIAFAGIGRSNRTNIAIVSLTLLALVLFVAFGFVTVAARGAEPLTPFFRPAEGGATAALLEATALMFVAFTGYARIATLGEEVKDPGTTIPRAIVATLIVTAVLYVAVGAAAISTLGVERLAAAARTDVAPLQVAASAFTVPIVAWVVTLGAVTAMLGVLLNLILGLSRMLLAMGRRGDAPAFLAGVRQTGSPGAAVVTVGILIGALALLGDVSLTWSFSAFTVLVYYGITNLAALRLPRERRRFPSVFAWGGLAACFFLAFWVETPVWIAGLGLIGLGLVWHVLAPRVIGAGGLGTAPTVTRDRQP